MFLTPNAALPPLGREPGPSPVRMRPNTIPWPGLDSFGVLQSLAYPHGGDINLAPGQKRHLPHEDWHGVEQAQRRLKPIAIVLQAINDDAGLECEAVVMGCAIFKGDEELKARPQATMAWAGVGTR